MLLLNCPGMIDLSRTKGGKAMPDLFQAAAFTDFACHPSPSIGLPPTAVLGAASSVPAATHRTWGTQMLDAL